MASLSATITQGCANGAGVLTLTQASPAPGAGAGLECTWVVLDADGIDHGGSFSPGNLPAYASGLPNGPVTARAMAYDAENDVTYRSSPFSFTIDCGPVGPSGLVLDFASATDETSAGDDGSVTIQASGGVPPLRALLLNLTQTLPATSGQPTTFPGLPSSVYTVRVFDNSMPTNQYVEATVVVGEYKESKVGCLDEYADNYDPAATIGDMPSCTYSTRWRSAWQPMAVQVAAVAGQTAAFVTAELRIGFRAGHPLNFLRPLGEPLEVRATVGPDGYATFRLGPYLQAALGAPDGAGGYRLDINEQTPDDYFVGYELRRDTGELLEQGYALNAAVPEAQLVDGAILSSFARVPYWPGYYWKRAQLASRSAGRYGAIDDAYPDGIKLPCPSNPLPVAWLNPKGGFDYWVFQGRPALGDTTSDGQQYREALTGQQRYSDPGDSYETFKASSGAFGGDDLLRGLRTLWRSPQAWYQPEPGGEWVPILIPRGDREVGRMGVRRQEVVLNFTTATPEWAQGQ